MLHTLLSLCFLSLMSFIFYVLFFPPVALSFFSSSSASSFPNSFSSPHLPSTSFCYFVLPPLLLFLSHFPSFFFLIPMLSFSWYPSHSFSYRSALSSFVHISSHLPSLSYSSVPPPYFHLSCLGQLWVQGLKGFTKTFCWKASGMLHRAYTSVYTRHVKTHRWRLWLCNKNIIHLLWEWMRVRHRQWHRPLRNH